MPNSTVVKDFERRRLVVERSYAAPAELIWACWTEAEHLRRWWGPREWLVDIIELDVRPGGVWRYRLRPAREHEMADEQWGRAVYRVIEAPHRLEFDDAFTDPSGTPEEGSVMPTAVSITADADRTAVSITVAFTGIEQLEQAEAIGMIEGFTDALDRLDAVLATNTGADHPADRRFPPGRTTTNGDRP